MTIVISNDRSILSNALLEKYQLSEVYLSVPQRAVFIGPLGLSQFLAHRGGSMKIPALAELEALTVDPLTLPPRHWQ